MRIKCENYIICGNHKCEYNEHGQCLKVAIALDCNGKCVLENRAVGAESVKPAGAKNF